MQPEKFRLDDVSVAQHGVESMIGVELQTWMLREFGVQVSVQALSNPKITFRLLANLVADHLHAAS